MDAALVEVKELPPRLQVFAKALLKGHDKAIEKVAKTLGVTRKKLVNVRREICWRMGRDSALALALNPRMAKAFRTSIEPRCEKCGLRGHVVKECDLPGIEYFASRRFETA
jgi:hypothetical protein